MKIAIIGSGISGLTAAYLLHPHHEITLFEAADRIGGHTATVDVEKKGQHYRIDTGFIVYNDWTYPNFIALMNEAGVESRESDMSFSVSCSQSGIEFAGKNGRLALYDGLFAQRRNLLSPAHLSMLLDILKFNRTAVADVLNDRIPKGQGLREYLQDKGLGRRFRDYYLVPMGASIWSTPVADMLDFPMEFMLPFMYRHGLLNVHNRPIWRTITGGSSTYLEPLCRNFKSRIRLSSPVTSVTRTGQGANLTVNDTVEQFDQVIFACHSDQALQILQNPTVTEREILGAIRYQQNEVVLHTDISQMPANRRAWASWNYLRCADMSSLPKLTYDMNRLMGIRSEESFLVTLNNTDQIDPGKILQRFKYAHPVFSKTGVAAQKRWHELNDGSCTWFCGAYWGKGFHEDGVNSAIWVAAELGCKPGWSV